MVSLWWSLGHQILLCFMGTQLECVPQLPLQLGRALSLSTGPTDGSGYVIFILTLNPPAPSRPLSTLSCGPRGAEHKS